MSFRISRGEAEFIEKEPGLQAALGPPTPVLNTKRAPDREAGGSSVRNQYAVRPGGLQYAQLTVSLPKSGQGLVEPMGDSQNARGSTRVSGRCR